MRNQAENKKDFAKTFMKLADSDRLPYFLKWYKKPIAQHPTDKYLYQYIGTHWERVDEEVLKSEISRFFKSENISYGVRTLNNLYSILKVEADFMAEKKPHLIAFKNGVLNKITGEFLPHKKENYLTACSDIIYSLDKLETPIFNQWIDFICENNEQKKQAILAALYMIFANCFDFQLFIEITGKGGTGKSIFNKLAVMLTGAENAISFNLKDLEDKAARSSLVGKSLVYFPDQEKVSINGEIIRSMTGGDLIYFAPKYHNGFNAKIEAIFLIVNNEPIIFKEKNGGIERRRVLFTFDKKPKKADPYLLAKLQNEISGIVRLLLDRFQNNPLEAKEILERQAKSTEALNVKQENDHIVHFASFFETQAEIKGLRPGRMLNHEQHHLGLYSLYKYKYCPCYDEKPLKQSLFIKAFKAALESPHKNPYPYNERWLDGYIYTNVYLKQAFSETYQQWKA